MVCLATSVTQSHTTTLAHIWWLEVTMEIRTMLDTRHQKLYNATQSQYTVTNNMQTLVGPQISTSV